MHGPTRPAARASRLVRVVVVAACLVGLAGCDAVADQAGEVADDVANRAASEVDQAVREQVDAAIERFGGQVDVQRICELIADDRLTGGERGRLEVAIEVGEALGLPQEVSEAGRRVLDATDGATDQVDELSRACVEAGASPQPDAS